MKPKSPLLALGLLVAGGLYAVSAFALAGPVPQVDSFSLSCGTSATRIVGDGVAAGGYTSLYIQNENATPVALGDSALTTTTAPRICNDTACVRADWSGDVTNLYCRAGSATTILVQAGR